MVGASKILTVSYGTFSCTLEGFDDPFSTMKSIAEYFRDLAADDRYFGAEPPTPDAEMLHRIAEREVQRRVEARVQEDGIVLRQVGKDEAAGAAPAAGLAAFMPQQDTAETAAEVPAEQAAPSPAAEADTFDRSDAEEAAAPAESQKAIAAPEPQAAAETVAEKLSRIRAVVAKSSDAHHADDEFETPVPSAGFYGAPIESAFADVSADTADAAAGSDLAAEHGYLGETAEDDTFEEGAYEDADAEEAIGAAEGPVLSPEEEDELMQELAAVESAAPSEEVEEDDAIADALPTDDDMGEDWEPEFAAMPEEAAAETGSEDEDDAYEASADEAWEAETAEDDDDDEESFAEDFDDEEEETEAREASEPAPAFEEPVEAEAAPDQADMADEDLEAEMAEADDLHAETPASEHDDDEDFDDEYLDDEDYDDDLSASEDSVADDEAARIEDEDEDEDEETIAPAAAMAESEAEEEMEAEDEAELDEADVKAAIALAKRAVERQPDEAPGRKVRGDDLASEFKSPGEGEAAFDRILEETNSKMDDSEGSRRRSAIAHLKAAVAATKADRLLKRMRQKEEEDAEEQSQYRDDLAKVVRPRRPEDTGDAATPRPSTARPEPVKERPAPLMLVSEQRVDDGESRPAAEKRAVMPRRINMGNLAIDEEEAGFDGDDGNFAEFAQRMGARELPDLLEAAAAYSAFVEGRKHFSRPQLMRRVASFERSEGFTREAGLRSFGQLLRQGKIQKLKRGQFTIPEDTRFNPEARMSGE